MMSHEEQVAQHDSIKNIESFANTVKKWWPVLTLICVLIGAGASVATAFFHYDNENKQQYATKADVKELSDKVDLVINKMDRSMNASSINHFKDSLNAVEIKNQVIENKTATDKDLNYIKRECEKFGFVTEQLINNKIVFHAVK